jgi:hypothetical protein
VPINSSYKLRGPFVPKIFSWCTSIQTSNTGKYNI